MSKWNSKRSKKGMGFEQPLAAHQHWHIDVSYINISGTFYYLCCISDNRPQFIAKDFKEVIRVSGMTHVRTSPYYPQSNDKSNVGTNR